MNHWYFIAPIAAVSYLVPIALGCWIGYKFRELKEVFQKIRGDFDQHLKDEEVDDGPAVITTTPQLIEAKRRRGELPTNDDEDSAIVTVKSPRQLKEEQDAKIKAELDEIQGHSSRIE